MLLKFLPPLCFVAVLHELLHTYERLHSFGEVDTLVDCDQNFELNTLKYSASEVIIVWGIGKNRKNTIVYCSVNFGL